MTNKTLYKAGWLWQDYTGAKWTNLSAGNTGDSHAAYVYPQGKNSKSSYRPKSLFYHYQVTGIDSDKYKLDSVKFVLVIGKFNTKSNPLPTIKVFSGDNNAPYKKDPIATVSSHTSLKNKNDFDSHTLQFTIKGVTISQLKNIIIEVDWGKTKISGASTISVNRARLSVDYSRKNPKFSLYESLNKTWATTNDKVAWKLTVKNTGQCGSGSVKLVLPKGVSVASSSGGGTYDSSSKTWSFSNLCKDKTVTRTFYLKSSSVGMKWIEARNNSIYATNLNVQNQVSFVKYVAPVNSQITVASSRDDIITYTFYETFAREEGQYFDVQIQGMKENHPYGFACFDIASSDNIRLETPLRSHVELLEDEDNVNIDGITRDSSFNYGNSTIELLDNAICFSLLERDTDFVVNLRVYMYCLDDEDGTITISHGGKNHTGTLDILPMKINRFFTEYTPSRDKQYVQNSVNIGAPNIWTIRAKSSSRNFFDEKKSDFVIAIEKLIAYIGCVPLSRAHKAGEKANTTNTKIDTTYLNRRYLGKAGNTREEIPMTLRIPWADVATLQGLVAMDKPIPIDTCPEIPDGDPVNHRGWAELTAVKNIRKINNMLYECEPEVDYLTHDLLTKFSIVEKDKLTSTVLDHFLSETHTYSDDLLQKFSTSYSQFFTNLEDEQGNIVGTYELEPATDLSLKSIDALKDFCNYNIRFRNTLPSLMSEDYDKNWEMAIRILNKDTGKMLFEHHYNNFKHYDFNSGAVLNQADVTTSVLQGANYNILNFDSMVLGYDSLAPLLEDNKSATHFNSLEDTVFNESNSYFELFLLNENNIGLPNQKIELRISNQYNYAEKFDLITDIFGRFRFKVDLENGEYNLECTYIENANNRSCEYSTDFTVDYGHTDTEFIFFGDFVTFVNNSYYEATLVDENSNPLSGKLVYYSFRDLASESYCHEESLVTNSNGKVFIPVVWSNGSKELKVMFKGDNEYNASFFEEIVDINIQGRGTVIESDDVELTQGDSEKIYYIILKDENNAPLQNKQVRICFYNQNENYVFDTTTNNLGVSKVPIYLNKGSWKVDTIFNGDSIYKPAVSTNNIWIKEYMQLETKILSQNIILDETEIMDGEQDYYTLTLVDENDNPVSNEPISISIYNNDKSTKYVDTVLKTDTEGVLEVPFVSHNETVLVEATYYGCNRYKSAAKSERISFGESHVKEDVSFYVVSTSDQYIQTNDLYLQEGELRGHVLYEVFDGRFDIIVTCPDNHRVSNKGGSYLASLNEGTFNVTFVYHGTDNYYPQMTTIEYAHLQDTRVSLSGGMSDFSNLILLQGLDNTYDYEYELENNYQAGSLAHLRIYCDYDLPDTIAYVGVGYNNNDNPSTLEELSSRSECVLTMSPQKWTSELGATRSYIDFNFIVPSNGKLMMLVPQTDFTPAIPLLITLTVVASNRNSTSIVQNGFGRYGQTYQDIFIGTGSENAAANELINEYFIAKLTNTNTFEELYYYSYLIDKENLTELKFMLEKGDWTLNILTKDTAGYNGAAYTSSATLNSTTSFEDTTLDPIFDYDNWTDKGDFSIENLLDGTYDTIELYSDTSHILHSILSNEFTTSNNFTLSFDLTWQYLSDYATMNILINADVDSDDCIGIALDKVEEYKDNALINTITIDEQRTNGKTHVDIERKGGNYIIYFDNKQVYISKNARINNIGFYLSGQGAYAKLDNWKLLDSANISEIINPPIDESSENINNEVFGSDVHISLRNNKLSLTDYGMLPEGEMGSGKIIIDGISLPDADYELEVWINYNNSRFERLNNLEGLMQMNIFEDVLLSDSALKYNTIQCSPVPVPNSITKFTRLCDEGTMYYIEKPQNGMPKYLCNPYIQYKGGTDLKTETGISIFNLDNAYSPVYMSNGLVRAEFHRRSGYIAVSRFDENTEMWYQCNIFKLSSNPQLYLDEDYSDDKATVRFGNTKWTMWRGRPFIKLEHPDDDLRILNLVDKVYCETSENEFSMGFVEERDARMSIFNPRTSIQQFKEELHIGQNIKTDNFSLCDVDENNNESELTADAELTTTVMNNEKAIQVVKNEGCTVGLNFPTSPNYAGKPGNTFSLLLGCMINHNEEEIIVKARGYDDRGKVPVKEGLQYGIWESSQTLALADSGEVDEIRATFYDVPSEVKYVDFLLIFKGNANSDISINEIMLHEGDSQVGHDIDTTKANASQAEISFDETYYACLFNDDSPAGLAIARPNKKKFSLRKLEASDETVLIPYMKKYAEHDAVENVILEYFNSHSQIINVDWEG